MAFNDRLRCKTCIITGSGGSIGRAACLRFAEEGAHVVGVDIAPGGAEETLRLVEAAGGTMISIHPADLTDKAECERVVSTAVERFGGNRSEAARALGIGRNTLLRKLREP
jgi:NAD(P)-dependent dehydrogenase (short-subunit alcohol dehydrogenase family)